MRDRGYGILEIHGPDIHFTGGRMIIPGYEEPIAGEVTISDGIISEISIGSKLPKSSSRGYERIDLDGNILSPAFYDAHMHYREWSMMRSGIDLSGARGWTGVMNALDRVMDGEVENDLFSASNILLGVNLDDATYSNGNEPDRKLLDSRYGDIPVLIRRICGHKAYVNTPFLESKEIRGPVPDDGILTDGKGIELAWDLEMDARGTAKCLDRGREELYKMGVLGGVEIISSKHLAGFREAYEEAGFGLRLNLSVVPGTDDDMKVPSGKYLPNIRDGNPPLVDINGMPSPVFSKLFADGSIGARTAAFDKEYSDGSKHDPLMSRVELNRSFERAVDMGLIPMVHAIGGRAVRDAVECSVDMDMSIRLEHAEDIDNVTMEKLGKMRGAVCLQPNFVSMWGGPGGMYEKMLGIGYLDLNRFHSIDRSGAFWCFGTDMMPPGPLDAITGALNHPKPNERLGFAESIMGFTTRSVRFSILGGKQHGILMEGMPADIIVLNGTKVDLLLIAGANPLI